MSNTPKVSIIMPSLNVGSYIRECIESVVNQTLREIEIICVDAGSTDGTLEVLQEYAAKDSRVHLIHSDKKSYGYQMNLGLDAATGEYIGIVETDDFVPADMFGQLYNIALQNNVDLVKADFYRFEYKNGKIEKKYNRLACNYENYYNRVINPKEEQNVFFFIMNTWSGIYKREFLLENNIRHNETPGASFQDTGFWFQTFCLADRVYFVDRPFYMNRRDNPNSSVFNKNKIYCPCDEFDFIYRFLEKHPNIKRQLLGIYQYLRYNAYLVSVKRSAEQHRREFFWKFSSDFRHSLEIGELDQSMFDAASWQTLNRIMKDPDKHYFWKHEQEAIQNALSNSVSYRIGRIITWFPRMLIKMVHSLKKCGFRKTFKKFINRLRGVG